MPRPKQARPGHLCALQNGHPFDSKEVQGSQLTVAGDRVRLLADTRFTRKPTAVHSATSSEPKTKFTERMLLYLRSSSGSSRVLCSSTTMAAQGQAALRLQKKVKRAVTPDSVRRGRPRRDRHSSGPLVAQTARCYLPANDPCGTTGQRCRCVGLFGIAARRDCPFHPHSSGSSLLL